MARKKKFKVATLDLETDPFQYGRVPHPFSAGFYDGENYHMTWGDNCIAEMMDYLESYPDPLRIYVHNGGGFDFWFMEYAITNPVFIINKRIAKCGLLGKHELRDSYKMIPVPLSAFEKESMEYWKMEEDVRDKHRKEIEYYLYRDCVNLYNMVTRFIDEYGDHLTIGGAAIHHLRELHPCKNENPYFDAMFRPYYVGGRNQCFKVGEQKGDFHFYDVNSLYPYTMHSYFHPQGSSYRYSKKLPDDERVYFAHIIADSQGALPRKKLNKAGVIQGLEFPHGVGEFFACSHEIKMGLQLGLLKIHQVKMARVFENVQKFDTYIDYHAKKKIEAEEAGDKGGRLFSKLFMNNGYGKFGQDPEKYRDYEIFDSMEELRETDYILNATMNDRYLGAKKCEIKPWSYNNVSIAASITSAARATLLHGLSKATNPIYCDTDSIVCERLECDLHDTRLGAWKDEASVDTVYIAGKKLYAAFKDGECIKKASKGVDLSPDLISKIATSDDAYTVDMMAPTLRFGQKAKFQQRKIRRTY